MSRSDSRRMPHHPSPEQDPDLIATAVWEDGQGDEKEDAIYSDHEVSELRNTILEKQAAIERMNGELTRHREAIKSCGEEIMDLRRKQSALETEKISQQRQAQRVQEQENRETEEVCQMLDTDLGTIREYPDQAAHHFQQLAKLYKQSQAELRTVKHDLGASQRRSTGYEQLSSKFKDLESNHLMQAAFIQKLQRQVSKMDAYKSTIRTQETVITKLEKLLAQQAQQPL